MSVYPRDRHISDYMDSLCCKYGHDPRAVAWTSKKTQEKRFEMLMESLPINPGSLLDVGAGQGDFYAYLQRQRRFAHYMGMDISREMVESAKKNYPEAHFIHENFLNTSFQKRFDYIIASGTFNYRVIDQEKYIQEVIEKLWRLSIKGVAFNLLSSETPKKKRYEDLLFYYDPEEVYSKCSKVSSQVKLIQGYLPNDFTIVLSKI